MLDNSEDSEISICISRLGLAGIGKLLFERR